MDKIVFSPETKEALKNISIALDQINTTLINAYLELYKISSLNASETFRDGLSAGAADKRPGLIEKETRNE